MEKRTISKDTIASGLLLMGSIIWGTVFLITQMAIKSGLSSTFIVCFKFVIASAILLCVFPKKLRNFSQEEYKCGIIAGVLLCLGFFAQTIGLKYTTPSNTAFLTATNIIMVPFITWILFKQKKPEIKLFIAAFLCFIGICVLTFSLENGFSLNLGDMFTLLCAFIFACHISYLSISAKKVDVIKLTFLQTAVSGGVALIAFLIFDIKNFTLESFKTGFWMMMYLSVFGTCITFLAQTFAQKHTSSTKAAIIMSTEALFGSILSVTLGFEPFTLNLMLGGMIVLGSAIMLEIRLSDFVRIVKKYYALDKKSL